ncbi:MAG: oligogalacturonate lyase family protein [Candidatus Poribacteria bacterium]
MSKGKVYPPEKKVFKDAKTDVTIFQMTDYPATHHNLYFVNPSCTPDGKTVIFVSDRSGLANLYKADIETGEIVQLTDIDNLNSFSATSSKDNRRVFFSAGGEVRAIDLETLNEEVLARFPDGRVGNCNLNGDDNMLVTSVRRAGETWITAVHTDGSDVIPVYSPPRSVGHVQFCPADNNLILYSSDITQRMWLVQLDGRNDRPLYLHGPEQWITHESWLGMTDEVIFTHWPHALKAIKKDSDTARIVSDFNAWHASSRIDGSLIISDTVCPDIGLQLIDPKTGEHWALCYPESSSQGTQWSEVTPAIGEITEKTYGPQWSHPHPSFSPDGTMVIYTSDKTGRPQVYVAFVPKVSKV